MGRKAETLINFPCTFLQGIYRGLNTTSKEVIYGGSQLPSAKGGVKIYIYIYGMFLILRRIVVPPDYQEGYLDCFPVLGNT